MRLSKVEHGHRLKQKFMIWMVRLTQRRRAPDVLRTLFYRPEFMGRALSRWTQAVMRGPSEWSVAERELFAAVTSRFNQCVY
jgi:hypothetical protein